MPMKGFRLSLKEDAQNIPIVKWKPL